MKTLALHLGVHKTATTHIQSRLFNSRDALRKDGIGYVQLGRLRRALTQRLGRRDFSASEVIADLKSHLDCDRLILSDENILGGPGRPEDNRIYPRAQARVAKVLDTFAAYEIEIYVTLRDYPAYFASRYAEALRHFPFCTFAEYYGDIDFSTVAWKELLDALIAAGAKSITVSGYDRIFKDERAYLGLLLGGSGVALAEADSRPEVRRAKFSAEGFEVIRAFAQHYPAETVEQMVRFLDGIAQKTPATAFMPFDEAQQDALRARYAAEMDALRAGAEARVSVRCG
jgi:hypothetical protein